MKKFIHILLIAIIAFTGVRLDYVSAAPQDGVVSAWKLDGNSNDSVGTNNGTDTNVGYDLEYGRVAKGAGFGGTGFVNAGTSTSLKATNTVSVSFWFKATTTATSFLVGKSSAQTGGWVSYGIYLNNGATNNLFYRVKTGSGTTFSDLSTTTSNATNGNWHHVVLVRNGATQLLYYDGAQLLSGGSGTTIFYDGDFEFLIGATSNGGLGNDSRFTGSIDSVVVWFRQITAAEVTRIYNNGLSTQYPFSGDVIFSY